MSNGTLTYSTLITFSAIDMSLKLLRSDNRLEKLIAFSLRFATADGASCTIAGWLDDN